MIVLYVESGSVYRAVSQMVFLSKTMFIPLINLGYFTTYMMEKSMKEGYSMLMTGTYTSIVVLL